MNNKILATNVEDFEKQLKSILKSNAKDEGIIYIWKTEKKIPRVCGESDILYIGKTKQSLNSRYNNTKSLDIEKQYFENVYKSVIKQYGAISIEVVKIEDMAKLDNAEFTKLDNYYKIHKELPPLNRLIPSKKNK
jgi:hypothetical protein